ncbi:acetate--CoA ligase family protein [Parasphingorhabdus sp.]|uniref:acetate--CoA ligase family protein n=1 Tax=Parasphingorhabdus sp. TaxID=2709688 RepID=UPI002F9340CE
MATITQDTQGQDGTDVHPLNGLFAPRTIALVGASEKSTWTHFILQNLRDFEFSGRTYAVNRGGVDVGGLKGFRSCRDIGEPVDVAFIFVPQSAMLDALDDVAAAGIRNVAILTSGYAEIGEEGAELQRELVAKAEEHGLVMWGPNSLGFNNVGARTTVSSIPAVLPLLPPQIAIISQSGATASELNEFAHSQNIGTSFVAATGNEAQLSLADVLDYLIDHEPTKAIALFAESIREPEKFAKAAQRAIANKKPIVILKIGRSELATEVAKAHTGSLAGNDAVFDAVCDRLGVIRVHSTEDLIITAGLLAATGPLPAPGLGFISISGGACTLVADAAEEANVSLPAFPDKTAAELTELSASFASVMNPLDVTGAAIGNPEMLEKLITVAASAPEIGLVGVNIGIPTVEGAISLPAGLAAIGRAAQQSEKPTVMILTTSKTLTDVTRSAIAEHGLPPIVSGIDAALRAAGKAAWWSRKAEKLAKGNIFQIASSSEKTERPALATDLTTERAVLDYLSSHSVPVIPAVIVHSRDEAAAAGLSGKLAMKVLSPDILHKTEVGGVRLNVAPEDAGDEYDSIMQAVSKAAPQAQIDGVILSPMREGGIELLVGITRDATWGLTLTLGFGGVLVELLADVAICTLPCTRSDIVEMLGTLKGAKLLDGFRGAEASDLDKIADAVVKIADEALALGSDLESLEINPLLVRGTEVEALDGLIMWKTDKNDER